MADLDSLEALQALHRELLAVCEHRVDGLPILEQSLETLADRFKRLLDKPPKKNESRDAVTSGSSSERPRSKSSLVTCADCWS